jgi:phage terminase large subunit
MDLNLEVNDIFRPYLEGNNTRTQIFYGGAGSGKSVFIAQRAVLDVLKGGRNYLICRAVGRYLKKSVWTQVRNVIVGLGIVDMFTFHHVAGVIECNHNGYQLIFTGLDDPEKLKSIVPAKGAITDIWIEEATETNHPTVRNLYKRQRGGDPNIPKRVTLSFNPILQTSWIFTEYFSKIGWAEDQTVYADDDLTILKTWYIHNRFLTPDDIKDLESETDEYFYQVYTLGNWGILGNVIFKNWTIQDLSDMHDQFTYRKNGLDFGFSADPAAVTVSHYDRKKKTIYIFDEFYERGLTNDLLADEVKALVGNEPITCDSAEPKSIAELRQHGVYAQPADKGKDSVVHGIQWLQQQNIVVDKNCINTINEFRQYKWKEDKDDNAIRQPVDKGNHIIDGLRYAYEDEMEDRWLIY